MDFSVFGTVEQEFLADLFLALVCGLIIGAEREFKKKPAGISTHAHVIGGAMMFSFMSRIIMPTDPVRIAAQIVSGVGFLGAGIILKSESTGRVTNLTTAASIWYSAAVGMALGFNLHLIAILATVYAVIISRIPKLGKEE
jgi:putative Mg2+ transporter-C (MgtC) family protein